MSSCFAGSRSNWCSIANTDSPQTSTSASCSCCDSQKAAQSCCQSSFKPLIGTSVVSVKSAPTSRVGSSGASSGSFYDPSSTCRISESLQHSVKGTQSTALEKNLCHSNGLHCQNRANVLRCLHCGESGTGKMDGW